MFALKRLNTGHFVYGERTFAELGTQRRLFISLTDGSDDGFPLRVLRRGEPVAYPMRLQIGFF
jgi:hypothetical protein